MAFQTIQGAGRVDFIGTDEVDVLVAVNVEQPSFVGGRKNNDSITYNQFATGVTRGATVQGGEGNDTLATFAVSADSSFNGNKGDDTININGIVTNVLIAGGEGNDTFTSPANMVASTLNGNKGTDTIAIAAPVASSAVLGGQDNDTIGVGGGFAFSDSTFNGNDGTDTITITTTAASSLTNVTFFGGQGGDTINAAAGFNGAGTSGFFLSGDKGNDNVTGSGGDDTILLGEGNDSALGGAGKDTIRGGVGDDVINGQAGTNLIVGGEGADSYDGFAAPAADTFVIEAITNSAATTSGTTQGFDTFSTANAFNTGVDKLDLKAVASALAGGPVNNLTGITTGTTTVATAANFGALKTALDAVGVAGSTTGSIQITQVTVTAGALAGFYLWVNDNQSAYNTGDLMFKTNTATQIGAGDIVLV